MVMSGYIHTVVTLLTGDKETPVIHWIEGRIRIWMWWQRENPWLSQ